MIDQILQSIVRLLRGRTAGETKEREEAQCRPAPAGGSSGPDEKKETEKSLKYYSRTDDFVFEFRDGKAAVKKYKGISVNVEIPPRTPGGTIVTEIEEKAFSKCVNLRRLKIPDSIEAVYPEHFDSCPVLKSLAVSENHPFLSAADGVLFTRDKRKLLIYPPGKTGPYSIPDKVVSIGERAFSGCSGLTEVTVPGSVTGIGKNAFLGCSNLAGFTIADGASLDLNVLEAFGCPVRSQQSVQDPSLISVDGVLFTGDKKNLLMCPPGKEGRYCIPAGVTGIGPYAFWNCARLTEVVLPDGVVTVGEDVFSGCRSLERITIPGSVTGMESRALYDPGRLIVTLPAHSRAEEYCRRNGLRYRYPGEERVRSLQDDDPEAYAESVFRMMEVYDEIVAGEFPVFMSACFMRMAREEEDTGEPCLYLMDHDLIIPEKEIGEPCPDMEKRIEAFFAAMGEDISSFPIDKTELLEKCSAVNAAVYELPEKYRTKYIRSWCIGDVLLIRACDLWYCLEFDWSYLD